MESLPFEPTHLDVEDLAYELKIRNIIIENGTRRTLTKALRECLYKELKGLIKAPTFVSDVNKECEVIHEKADNLELDLSISESVRVLSKEEIKTFISKFKHLLYRLDRFSLISLNSNSKYEIGKLTERILKDITRLNKNEFSNIAIVEDSRDDEGLACAITTSDSIRAADYFGLHSSQDNIPRSGAEETLAQAPFTVVSTTNTILISTPGWSLAPTATNTPSVPVSEPIPIATGAIRKNSVCAINTENTYSCQNPIASVGKGRGRGGAIVDASTSSNYQFRNSVQNTRYSNTASGFNNNYVPLNKPVTNFNHFANVKEVYPPISNYRLPLPSGPNYAPINMHLPGANLNVNQFTNPAEVCPPRPNYNSNMYAGQTNASASNFAQNNQPNFNRIFQDPIPARQLPFHNHTQPLIQQQQQQTILNPAEPYQYFQEPNQNNQEFRHWNNRNPVAGWNLFFSGDPGTRSLYDFLSRIQMLARAEQVSPVMLRQSAYYLFSGSAMTWFRAFEHTLPTWEALINGLQNQFVPYDYDRELLREIESRKQGKFETFGMYLANLEMLYRGLQHTFIPEFQKLDTIMRNMLPHLAEKLVLTEIISMEQLSNLCRRIENFQFRMNKANIVNNPQGLLEPQFSYVQGNQGRDTVRRLPDQYPKTSKN